MYWVYVLENEIDKGWYIGFTANFERRLSEHKSGTACRTTSLRKGWKLIYCEGYIHKQDALGRERFLKSGSGRNYLKKQLIHHLHIT